MLMWIVPWMRAVLWTESFSLVSGRRKQTKSATCWPSTSTTRTVWPRSTGKAVRPRASSISSRRTGPGASVVGMLPLWSGGHPEVSHVQGSPAHPHPANAVSMAGQAQCCLHLSARVSRTRGAYDRAVLLTDRVGCDLPSTPARPGVGIDPERQLGDDLVRQGGVGRVDPSSAARPGRAARSRRRRRCRSRRRDRVRCPPPSTPPRRCGASWPRSSPATRRRGRPPRSSPRPPGRAGARCPPGPGPSPPRHAAPPGGRSASRGDARARSCACGCSTARSRACWASP